MKKIKLGYDYSALTELIDFSITISENGGKHLVFPRCSFLFSPTISKLGERRETGKDGFSRNGEWIQRNLEKRNREKSTGDG